jgi:hypothetical protein
MFLNFRSKLTMNEKFAKSASAIVLIGFATMIAIGLIEMAIVKLWIHSFSVPESVYTACATPFILYGAAMIFFGGPLMLISIDEDAHGYNLSRKDRAFFTRIAWIPSTIACLILIASIMNHANIHITGDDTGMYEFFSRIAAAFLLNFVYSAIMKPIVAKFVTFKVQPFEEQK